ncbi:hypothetical protein CTEN210_06788 [Chaetoceros tenuissimus]|uniref:G-protein coupled receptors family 1 profile domain-containing protein n=1 Tax=Chaetoceros tenuissimus TaxID=426638 RepID=A0AAD3H4I8_9STRA|nr:hypothetical protein CTEN210_06788 [Chaetoceros tenuissimus]
MVSKLIKTSQIIRCVTSSISLIGSLSMTYMIWNSPRGNKSPYSRIIFGMGIADIMQSLGILISPFVSPARDALWGLEPSTQACEAVGLFLGTGFIALPLYTLFLIYYFLQRVKYKVKPEDFSKQKSETIVHTLIWAFPFLAHIYALAKKEINSSRYGSICMIVPSPFGCWLNDSCERGENARMTLLFSFNIPLVVIFLFILISLTSLTHHVYMGERLFAPSSVKNGRSNKSRKSEGAVSRKSQSLPTDVQVLGRKTKVSSLTKDGQHESITLSFPIKLDGHVIEEECKQEVEEECKQEIEQELNQVPRNEHLVASYTSNEPPDMTLQKQESNNLLNNTTNTGSRDSNKANDLTKLKQKKFQYTVTRQSFHQSSLYILAFLLSYTTVVVEILLALAKVPSSEWTFFVTSLFMPATGFFNILIYTRPKVALLKRSHPNTFWIQRFIVVVFCGEEMPISIDEVAVPPLSQTSIKQKNAADTKSGRRKMYNPLIEESLWEESRRISSYYIKQLNGDDKYDGVSLNAMHSEKIEVDLKYSCYDVEESKLSHDNQQWERESQTI